MAGKRLCRSRDEGGVKKLSSSQPPASSSGNILIGANRNRGSAPPSFVEQSLSRSSDKKRYGHITGEDGYVASRRMAQVDPLDSLGVCCPQFARRLRRPNRVREFLLTRVCPQDGPSPPRVSMVSATTSGCVLWPAIEPILGTLPGTAHAVGRQAVC